MKRFFTYMHEYKKGCKTKNAGFIQVNIQGEKVYIEINVSKNRVEEGEGIIYLIVAENSLLGIEVGSICLKEEKRKKVFTEKSRIQNTKYALSDVVGIVVDFKGNDYLASCWNEKWMEDVTMARFDVHEATFDRNIELEKKEIVSKEEIVETEISPNIIYKKIKLGQLQELSSANWHLRNNKFLLHGVSNYGFLFLKKENEKLWLGVPGYYEKQELLMAMLFGFLEFKAVPKVVVNQEMQMEIQVFEENTEKNQEPKTGVFGGWFLLLDK